MLFFFMSVFTLNQGYLDSGSILSLWEDTNLCLCVYKISYSLYFVLFFLNLIGITCRSKSYFLINNDCFFFKALGFHDEAFATCLSLCWVYIASKFIIIKLWLMERIGTTFSNTELWDAEYVLIRAISFACIGYQGFGTEVLHLVLFPFMFMYHLKIILLQINNFIT